MCIPCARCIACMVYVSELNAFCIETHSVENMREIFFAAYSLVKYSSTLFFHSIVHLIISSASLFSSRYASCVCSILCNSFLNSLFRVLPNLIHRRKDGINADYILFINFSLCILLAVVVASIAEP